MPDICAASALGQSRRSKVVLDANREFRYILTVASRLGGIPSAKVRWVSRQGSATANESLSIHPEQGLGFGISNSLSGVIKK